ncbi:MAG: hypothetical protein ABI417_03440 [Coleofasciculaceae cyanobacterium]|jgi:hypothetical protein
MITTLTHPRQHQAEPWADPAGIETVKLEDSNRYKRSRKVLCHGS